MHRQRRTGWKKTTAILFATAVLLAYGYARLRFAWRGEPWDHWDRAEDAGYSSQGIENARAYVDSLATTGLMVVVDGKVLLQEGDVEALGYMAAGRFSIMAMVFGRPVADGIIDLSKTLGEIGVDDQGGLLPVERKATIGDLLADRSGVYHPAAPGYDPAGMPPRGSVEPGTRFFPNPWGGFALRGIFEVLTGRSLRKAIGEDLSNPLRLQDFKWWRQNRGHNRERSDFTDFNLYVSTRDVARFGQLMLQKGEWRETRLIPREWVERMTTMVTPPEEIEPDEYRAMGLGFGLQWWIWPDQVGPYAGAYTYTGAFGQYLTVLPTLRMVVAHQVFAGWSGPPEGTVSWPQYLGLLDRLAAARQPSLSSGTPNR